ncbi:hypothetical protein D3C81_1309480 [compost metagenome]
MRAVLAQRFDISNAQLVTGNPEVTQAEILGDRIVFAVAGALPQRLDRRFPVIDLVPQIDVFDIAHLFVEEQVHHFELFHLADLFLRGQQILPGINALLAGTQRPVECRGFAADRGKIPIGMQTAQHDAGQQQCAA